MTGVCNSRNAGYYLYMDTDHNDEGHEMNNPFAFTAYIIAPGDIDITCHGATEAEAVSKVRHAAAHGLVPAPADAEVHIQKQDECEACEVSGGLCMIHDV